MNYLIVKDKKKKQVIYFECNKLNGYQMTAKNKNIKLKDAINVNKMVIINPSFINKLIDKNINRKLEKLIKFIIGIYDADDDPAGNLMLALNEVEKFKREIINKYLAYMNKKQLKDLDQKLKILENQVTMQSYLLNESKINNESYETSKAR